MSRGLAAAVEAVLDDAWLRPILFVELQFDAGTEYLHDHLGTINWGGNDWTGAGDLGRVQTLTESDDGTPHALQFTLSGLNSTFVTETLSNDYFGRPVICYLSAIDDAGALLATPDEVWRGGIDILEGSLDGSLLLVAESEIADFGRASGELYSDTQQQSDHTGDLFFEYADQTKYSRVIWGSGTPVTFGSVSNRGTIFVPQLGRRINLGDIGPGPI